MAQNKERRTTFSFIYCILIAKRVHQFLFLLRFSDLCFELEQKNFQCAIHPEVTLCVTRDNESQELTN